MKKLVNSLSNFFSDKKAKVDAEKKIPPDIVNDCFAYLAGRECSDEIQKRIGHYLNQNPHLTKTEAVEMLLDFEERKLKN